MLLLMICFNVVTVFTGASFGDVLEQVLVPWVCMSRNRGTFVGLCLGYLECVLYGVSMGVSFFLNFFNFSGYVCNRKKIFLLSRESLL